MPGGGAPVAANAVQASPSPRQPAAKFVATPPPPPPQRSSRFDKRESRSEPRRSMSSAVVTFSPKAAPSETHPKKFAHLSGRVNMSGQPWPCFGDTDQVNCQHYGTHHTFCRSPYPRCKSCERYHNPRDKCRPRKDRPAVSKVRHLVADDVKEDTWRQVCHVCSSGVVKFEDSPDYTMHMILLRQQNIDQGLPEDDLEGIARKVSPYYFEDGVQASAVHNSVAEETSEAAVGVPPSRVSMWVCVRSI